MTIDDTERRGAVAGGSGIVGHALAAELKRTRLDGSYTGRRLIEGMDTISRRWQVTSSK